MSEIQHFTDADFDQKIASGTVLVDFYADWCGPCRMLAPVLEQLAKDVADKAIIAKVDIDKEQQTAAKFNITSVPTMIIFKEGKEAERLVGLQTADAIREKLLK